MNDDLRAAIIRLLETRDDNLPEPSRRVESVSGFAGGVDEKGRALRTMTCPDCLDRQIEGKRVGCETCGGSGTIPDKGKDPMDTPVVLSKEQQSDPRRKANWGGNTRIEGARERDRQLAVLDHQLAPPKSEAELLEEANRRGYVWERERDRMYRHFDYAALDVALDALRNHDESAYHALHAVYVYAWLTELSPGTEVALERGLVFLDERLPENLRAPAPPGPVVNMAARGRTADPRAIAQRDAEIRRRAAEENTPSAQLASDFGISVSQVNRIIREARSAA